MAGFAAGHGLRLGSNLLLTRMIAPEAFGIMLLVNVVLMGVGQFGDVGIGPSIIQNQRDDAAFLNTAWTIQFVRGLVLSAIAVAIAYPVAVFFHEPILAWLIGVSGLVGASSGLRSTKMFTANRHLAIGRLTLLEFASRVLGVVVTIGWALVSPSVWALAVGGIVAELGRTVLSHAWLPGIRNRFRWDREAASTLFTFGKWVFLSTLMGFIASQADRIVFGKLVDMETLGIYAIATLIASTPQQVLRHLALTINFPLYSHTVREGGDLPHVFRNGRRRLLLLSGVVCSLMLAGGPAIIDLLYQEAYLDAGWMVQLLAVATWFNALQGTVEAALLARGESQRVAFASIAKIVAMAILIPLGFAQAGFPGAIVGFACSELVRAICLAVLARPAKLGGVPQAAGYTLVFAAASAVGYAVAHWTTVTLGLHVLLVNLALGVVVVAVWLPLAAKSLRGGHTPPRPRPAT